MIPCQHISSFEQLSISTIVEHAFIASSCRVISAIAASPGGCGYRSIGVDDLLPGPRQGVIGIHRIVSALIGFALSTWTPTSWWRKT